VFDLDSIAAQRIGFDGGDQTLRLRAGTYSLAAAAAAAAVAVAAVAAVATDGLVESCAFLGDPEITPTKNTTVTYDARKAAEAKVSTERASVRRGGSSTYVRVIDGWVLFSSRSFTNSVKAIYLADTSEAKRRTFEVIDGWQLESPESAPSRYLYSLAFTHDKQIKGGVVHKLRDKQLASIDANYYTPGKNYTNSEYVDVWRPWSLNLSPTGSRGSVAAPTRVEHLVTAEREPRSARWSGMPMR
jgi:hypothetical protein